MSLGSNPPETLYAPTDEGYVAYQVFGRGGPDVLFITSWLSNLELMWEAPAAVRFFDRLSSFCRIVFFDKRGSGLSDPVPLASLPTLDEWMDDARAVVDAAGLDEFSLIGDVEGGPMALLFAASYPDRVSSLVLVNTFARWERADDYPIGMPPTVVGKSDRVFRSRWGTFELYAHTAPSMAEDGRSRAWLERYMRHSAAPAASASVYRWVMSVDVRSVLPTIRVPTLVLQRRDATYHRPEFSRYLADQIPGARYVELLGADTAPFFSGDFEATFDEIEEFLTGIRAHTVSNRTLATVMFTDIVDSTKHAARLGDQRWLELLGEHDRLTRDYLARYRGEEIQTTGDGFKAIFDGPTRAVTCAAELRDAMGGIGIDLRAGLHTGEIELTEDGFGGIAVHLAARVLAAQDQSEVLVSGTVRDLVVGSGIEFESRGIHDLKGIPGDWPLYAVARLP